MTNTYGLLLVLFDHNEDEDDQDGDLEKID
jgi:hypothetical protein